MNKNKFILALFVSASLSACKVTKKPVSSNQMEEVILNEINIAAASSAQPAYQPSAKREVDMLHMKLSVSFNYEKQHVNGQSLISFRPLLNPISSVTLDAQHFLLHRVALVHQSDTVNLKYQYDLQKLTIQLNKTYQSKDTFFIYINYTARPNETTSKGSEAITDAKGLYFINPTGEDGSKPRQIWTQGETQSNSCWFPVIDAPNEKITQEIAITVDDSLLTLSNGELMLSKQNGNGKRTDYWKQTKPHAPYLTMLAVGKFAVVKDHWRDSIDVDYYVEPTYEPYAKMVFGHTPEMMEFFSNKLGVAYPWDKYAQIVVRDFVSGAMENTGAVIHFDGLQHNSREHLDETHESIISHELFHHWFGDLVTCESWSNIPLNESFATYGSYLWDEYKYGRMEADYQFQKNLTAYLNSSGKHRLPLIRYRYNDREEMFDVLSYQKGSRILHLLRYTIGDEAFFKALNTYLKRHQYSTVEIHQLRLVFEEVTGEDLNWFFNQWFMAHGHPTLEISYTYNTTRTEVKMQVKQVQDTLKHQVFTLPLFVDLYTASGKKRERIEISRTNQTYEWKSNEPILFINPDAEKVLPGILREEKTLREWIAQYEQAPLYMDKVNAIQGVFDYLADSVPTAVAELTERALKHPFYGIRMEGLSLLSKLNLQQQMKLSGLVLDIAKSDPKSLVRAEAIEASVGFMQPAKVKNMLISKLQDSSYLVQATALGALESVDTAEAAKQSRNYITSENGSVAVMAARVLANLGGDADIQLIKQSILQHGHKKYELLVYYFSLLRQVSLSVQIKEIETFKALRSANKDANYQEAFVFGYNNYLTFYERLYKQVKEEQSTLKKKDPMREQYEQALKGINEMVSRINAALQ